MPKYLSRDEWIHALKQPEFGQSIYSSFKINLIQTLRKSFCKGCIIDPNCTQMCFPFVDKINKDSGVLAAREKYVEEQLRKDIIYEKNKEYIKGINKNS